MENLELAYAMFNQYLFQEAKNNIEYLEYYFRTNPATGNNRLITELVEAVKTYSLDNIDMPLFQSIIARSGKNEAESKAILDDILVWKHYSKEKMEPARKLIQNITAGSIFSKANHLYQDRPAEMLKYLKNVNFKTSNENYMTSVSFDQIDINSIVADMDDDGIPSKYSWINDSFQPLGAYARGQMVLVTMAPGAGKSLFALSEALHMASNGYKVHYLAMGDMSYRDQLIRMAAMYTGQSFGDAYGNLATIYKEMSNTIGDRLHLMNIPADKVTAEEYVDYMKDTDFDVLVIDYDSNFKSSNVVENMYSGYGEVYSKLTELTLLGKLVFILSQSKVNSWNNPQIQLSEVGESSRKQHTADVIITRGREVNNPNHLGQFKIVKNRRGEEGVICHSIRLGNGRFKEIPAAVYDRINEIKDKMKYTEADIDMMIKEHNNFVNPVNSQMIRGQALNTFSNPQAVAQQFGTPGPLAPVDDDGPMEDPLLAYGNNHPFLNE